MFEKNLKIQKHLKYNNIHVLSYSHCALKRSIFKKSDYFQTVFSGKKNGEDNQ